VVNHIGGQVRSDTAKLNGLSQPFRERQTKRADNEMRLAKYLTEKSLTAAEFAKKVSVSDESIRRYLRGDRRPSAEVMKRIARRTKGEVTANDFYAE
jgi:predicted transcriptional regulator